MCTAAKNISTELYFLFIILIPSRWTFLSINRSYHDCMRQRPSRLPLSIRQVTRSQLYTAEYIAKPDDLVLVVKAGQDMDV